MTTTATTTAVTATTRAGRWRRAGRRAPRVVSRATAKDANDPFEALARAILPREVNEARREMEYFDGAGGVFARANPWNAKPTIETPVVREGEGGTGVIFDFETMGEERFERSFNALNDVVMGGATRRGGDQDEGRIRAFGGDDGGRAGGLRASSVETLRRRSI